MDKLIKCDCGVVIQAPNDDELVAIAQKHAQEVHHLNLTREQLLDMARPA
jgi:predicted small metal-binding protein